MDLTTKQYRHNKIPIVERPGVYAYHLIPPARLKQIEVEHSRPLYIGRTANLAERNHFEHKTSGFSTLRRSLGALLKDELKLQAIPRDSGKKVYYKFTPRGEKRLTEWMKKNLRYSFEVVDGDVRARESELIEARKPPLNLLGWPNPQSKKIKDLREGCKLEAKKHLITRQANPQETGPSVRTKTSRASSSMVVAGVMSGTSADGVDVAVCRISAGVKGGLPRVKILGHVGFRYSKAVRAAALRVMEGGAVTAAEMSRLNWRLGEIYADCVEKACAVVGVGTSEAAAKMGHPGSSARLGLVGCHGQTVFHQSTGARWLGKEVRGTWQMGEASVIAERLGVPVVSDFRPADLAAGGQGAPLVPMLDYVMFRSDKVSRVMQNLGGIGNLTAIPAGAGVEGVMAFDTGPGEYGRR